MSTGDANTARGEVAASSRVMVITGAGISTASGIPDYRGPSGVWTTNPAAERSSRADVYANDAEVREAYWRRLLERSTNPPRPNEAHYSLARFERTRRLSLVVTQNIDGLHLEAGTSFDRLIEVHGHVRSVRCLVCDDRQPTGLVLSRVANGDPDPRCEAVVAGGACGGVLTTTIVRFGDQPDPLEMHRAKRAVRECDLLLCVGSTLAVVPVALLVPLALDYDVPVVIVNNAETSYDDSAICVRGDITDVLPVILGP
jgi:NAD-dependent deacetylase